MFSEGLAAVKDETGWFYIDPYGAPITEERYFSAGQFHNGLAAVSPQGNGDPVFIDYDGDVVLGPFANNYRADRLGFYGGYAITSEINSRQD